MLAPSLPWGSSLKHPYAAVGGCRSPLYLVHVNPSLVGDEVLVQREDVKDTMVMRVILGVDDAGHHTSEGSRGKDGDLLWIPIICVEIECPASLMPPLVALEMVEVEATEGRDVGDVSALSWL